MRISNYISKNGRTIGLEGYDDQELSDYAGDAFDDDATSIGEVDQAIAAMESLNDIYSRAEQTGKTDASDSIYANYAFESIVQITGVDMSVTKAALESCNFTDNKTLAQEAVRDSSASTVSAVAEWLTRRFKNNVDGMLGIFQKLSSILGSQWVLHDAMTKVPFPFQWWVAFMSNYRLLVRSSAVLFACASGAQNFSRGNIHTALTLVENAR